MSENRESWQDLKGDRVLYVYINRLFLLEGMRSNFSREHQDLLPFFIPDL